MPRVRITNTTALQKMPGHALDFEGKFLRPGQALALDLPVIPIQLEDWQNKGWVKIQDADDKTPVAKAEAAEVTLGTNLKEVSASDDIMHDDEGIDLTIAREAAMPGEKTAEDLKPGEAGERLAQGGSAKVSLGQSEEKMSPDAVSPIPGDKPKNVDNNEQFTVKAKRGRS